MVLIKWEKNGTNRQPDQCVVCCVALHIIRHFRSAVKMAIIKCCSKRNGMFILDVNRLFYMQQQQDDDVSFCILRSNVGCCHAHWHGRTISAFSLLSAVTGTSMTHPLPVTHMTLLLRALGSSCWELCYTRNINSIVLRCRRCP